MDLGLCHHHFPFCWSRDACKFVGKKTPKQLGRLNFGSWCFNNQICRLHEHNHFLVVWSRFDFSWLLGERICWLLCVSWVFYFSIFNNFQIRLWILRILPEVCSSGRWTCRCCIYYHHSKSCRTFSPERAAHKNTSWKSFTGNNMPRFYAVFSRIKI